MYYVNGSKLSLLTCRATNGVIWQFRHQLLIKSFISIASLGQFFVRIPHRIVLHGDELKSKPMTDKVLVGPWLNNLKKLTEMITHLNTML